MLCVIKHYSFAQTSAKMMTVKLFIELDMEATISGISLPSVGFKPLTIEDRTVRL
jgi:hypothetical protein